MALSGEYGIKLSLRNVSRTKNVSRNDYILFSESNSRFLVEVSERRRADFEALMRKNAFSLVGKVREEGYLSVDDLNNRRVANASLAELRRAWKRTLGGRA